VNETFNSDPRIFEIYKMSVDMADRVSARRANANAYFITIQGALVAALGFLAGRTPAVDDRYLMAITAVGVLASGTWFLLLRSYRDLNRAKFTVINELETLLPLQPFADEWSELKRDPVRKWRPRYAELGTIERVIPVLFGLVNLSLAVSIGCG
jgi:hypothetical protein